MPAPGARSSTRSAAASRPTRSAWQRTPRRGARARGARDRRVRDQARASSSSAASCCRASASRGCSTAAATSSSCARSPGLGMHDDDGKKSVHGGGSIVGIGVVAGKRCVVSASDSAIKGGTVAPMGLKKALRAQEIARENKLPLIALVESGGANLLYQAEIFVEGGRSFANQARLSAAGIPQIAVVHGSSTAGGAYLPGLSRLRGAGARTARSIYLAGPPLVKAAIGEDATDEELGGAQTARRGHRPRRVPGRERRPRHRACARAARQAAAGTTVQPRAAAAEPRYDAERADGHRAGRRARALRRARGDRAPRRRLGLPRVQGAYGGRHGLRPRAHRRPPRSASSATTARSSPRARPRRRSSSSSATRPARRWSSCRTPPATWSARPPSAPAPSSTARKMIQAVANARVPKFTVVLGGSFGAGNYGMCGRGFDPRFIFAWPTARTAVMGGAQAAKVMDIVAAASSRACRRCRPTTSRTSRRDERRSCASGSTPRALRCSAPRGCGTTASSTRATRAACSALCLAIAQRGRARTLASQHLRRRAHVATPGSTIHSPPGAPHEVHRPNTSQLDDTVAQVRATRKSIPRRRVGSGRAVPAHEVFKKLGDLGLLGLKYPEEYGGAGLDFSYSHGDGRGAGPVQLRRRADGHRRADRHVHAGAGALRQRRAAARVPRAVDRRRHGRLPRRQRARRRLRRRRHQDHGAQGRRRLRHQRQQDVDHQRPAGRLVLPARQHQRRRRRTRTSA